jgi:competence protein ComEC
LAFGIAAGEALSIAPWLAWGALALSLGASWLLFARGKGRAALALALLAIAAAGAGRAAQAERAYESTPLHAYESDAYLDVVGTLLSSPGREPDKDILILGTESIRDKGRDIPMRGVLRLSVPFDPAGRPRLKVRAGERVRASVRLASGEGFRNFGSFSYGRYLRNRGIHRRASTKSSLLVEKLCGTRPPPILHAISGIRCRLQEALEAGFPAPGGRDISAEGAVLEALLLGEDGRMSPETVLSLQKTGLYHLFAISGGHIAIITFLLFSLFRLVRVPQRASYAILIVFLVFYTLLVEGSPSVMRATLMTLAFLVGKLIWRDVRVLNTISASAFVLLLDNPFSLFDAGFQLTYAATLAIIVFCPRMAAKMPRLPFGLAEMTAMSAAAVLGVLPIIAANFNRVTFASLALNLAAIPLVGLIMGLGYVYLPLAAALPAVAHPFAAVLKALVSLFGILSHLLDGVGILSYRVPTPHRWTVAGYYICLVVLMFRPKFMARRGIAGAAFGVFASFALVLITYPFPSTVRELTVTMIDVGQGDSVLVEFPGRTKMLIDGGGFAGSLFDVGDRVVSPFLWSRGIKRIDILVLSHPHPDHMNGLASVAANFRIGEFWEGGAPGAEIPAYRDLLAALPSSVARRRIVSGFRRRIGDLEIEALHPESVEGPASEAAENDRSLVLRVSGPGTPFLFTGDIGRAAEQAVLDRRPEIRSGVLKAPHHGSGTSSSAAFLDRVRPAVVLVPVGEGNRYGFPAPAVLDRYRAAGVAMVLRTDLCGAVEVVSGGKSLKIRVAALPEMCFHVGLTCPTK